MGTLAWRFITVNTHNSWHHGDPDGFRSRGHRIHSSGDYRNPPPTGEHANLLAYRLRQSGAAVILPTPQRPRIGRAFVEALMGDGHTVWVVSVSSDHLHALVQLPDDIRQVRSIVGNAKRKASRAVKDELPGTVWSANGDYRYVRDREHLENCVGYVLFEQGEDSWTWKFASDEVERIVERQRALPGR